MVASVAIFTRAGALRCVIFGVHGKIMGLSWDFPHEIWDYLMNYVDNWMGEIVTR